TGRAYLIFLGILSVPALHRTRLHRALACRNGDRKRAVSNRKQTAVGLCSCERRSGAVRIPAATAPSFQSRGQDQERPGPFPETSFLDRAPAVPGAHATDAPRAAAPDK